MTVPRSMLRCMDTKTKETSQQISSGGMAIIGVQQAIIGVQHPLHRQSLRSLPAQTRFTRFVVGSAPPPQAKPAEPPRSNSLRSVCRWFSRLLSGFSTPSPGSEPGEPPRSETRFARLGAAGSIAHPLTSLRSCLSSATTGASPLSLASLGYVFSAAAFRPARRPKVQARLWVRPGTVVG